MKKYIYILFVLFFNISYAADEIVGEFIYGDKAINLTIYKTLDYKKFEKNKYGGKIIGLDSIVLNGYDIWIGGFEVSNNFSKFGVFYFDGKEVKRIIDIYHGFFVRHKDEYYFLSEDLSDPHAVVSSFYRLYADKKNKIQIKEIYKLPGFIRNFNTDNEELLASGYVNTLPFALAISNNTWRELRYVEQIKN